MAALDLLLVRILKACALIAIVALFFLLFIGIVGRQFALSLSGPLEFVEFLFIWIILLTVVLLWRENDLYRVNLIDGVHPTTHCCIIFFVEVLKLLFCVLIVWQGYIYAVGVREVTPFLQIDKAIAYGSVPVCGFLMGVYSVRNLMGIGKAIISSGSNVPEKAQGKDGSI